MSIKEQILKDLNISEILPSDIASVPSELEGDYSIPCFKLAKLKQKSPAIIATEICNETSDCCNFCIRNLSDVVLCSN